MVADLIVLPMSDFDIILGMNWLTRHWALVDCPGKKVLFPLADGQYIVFHGMPETGMPMISAVKATRMMFKGYEAYLACVVTTIAKATTVQDVPIVRDYLDVFPDELPGLPPHRAVDFEIRLVPGTELISKAPYRLAPVEMVELKVQLQDLLDKGFIRPSVSPWGAPVLFVKKDGSM